MLRCEECRCITATAEGWIAKVDEDDEPSYFVLYCTLCAEREFDVLPKRPHL